MLGEPKRRELLAHCQVLCRRCHTIKTAEDRGYTLIPAATIRRLWQLRGLGLGEVGLSRELGISKWQARAILAGAAYSKYRY